MKTFQGLIACFAAALALLLSSSAHAIPVMNAELDDFMAQAAEVKNSLSLSPNQQHLWSQVEAKMRAIAEARRRRRAQLQTDMKKGLSDPRAELRDLAKTLDVEYEQSHQENKQLRELFLTVNDALDDNQRQKILVLLADQLQRVDDAGSESKCELPKAPSTGRPRGGAGPGTPPQQ
jgi:flagellar biosynthesis chaperone FliJ